jgi:hypothetical protein
MITLTALLLFATAEESATTLPRQREPAPMEQTADPLYDGKHVATDDPAFVLTAIESGRQGVVDAGALGEAATPALKEAAARIESQNRATTDKLEALAKRKGWRLPDDNPNRASTVKTGTPARSRANFVMHQIAWHQATVEQFRAQIAGKGDAELKKTLRAALPGYEKNLQALLALEPARAL